MRVRKQDSNGDMVFGSSQLDFYINTPATIGQIVQTSLLLWLGEWYLNLDEGTPFLEGILGKHSKDIADATILSRMRSVDGVVSVDNYESTVNPVSRQLSASATLNTIYGVTQIQVSNYANF